MVRYFKETRPEYGGSNVTYTALADHPDPAGETPHGEITARVRNESHFPNFNFRQFRDVSEELGVSERYADDHPVHGVNVANANDAAYHTITNRGTDLARRQGIRYAKNVSDIKKDKDFQPTELFTTIPKSVEVTGAFVDPSLKSSFLTMGALLHQEHGVPITASHNLSRWSSAVTKNAQKKGLPIVGHEDNPDMEKTNEISRYSHYPMTKDEGGVDFIKRHSTPVPEHEVKSARQHLRSMLGHPPKDTTQHLSSQFAQPSFPGMENS